VVATSPLPHTSHMTPSTETHMNAALQTLYSSKDAWVQTSIPERLQLLDDTFEAIKHTVEDMVRTSQQQKNIPAGHPGRADDFAFGALLFRQIRLLRRSLREIQTYGRPQAIGELTRREDGRWTLPVFPTNTQDELLYNGITGDLWFRPGLTEQDIRNGQARIYRSRGHRGRVALVLGAGNVMALIPGDFLYKLFVEDRVVVLKMNPVNEYLGPFIEAAYRPFIARGFLQVVYGDVDEATYLIEHPYVEELHITGSDKTHDAIVFGPGEEGARRKRERNPKMTKRFTSELGNITPIIVVPGPWSDDDVRMQANQIAGQLFVNAGFNCLTPRVIVQHADWPDRDRLNEQIGAMLREVPPRDAFYPGAAQRHAAFIQAHPDALQYGDADSDQLPWTYIPGLDPAQPDDIAYHTEAFCSLMTETALDAPSPADFLDQAVAFVNDTLWGTLTAMIIIHPASLEDPAVNAAYERALADLRYGTICVNVASAFGYVTGTTAWGGHAGSDIYDVQSGIGFVNNLLFFDDNHIQKSVVTAPFQSLINSQSTADSNFARFTEGIMWLEAGAGLRTTLSFARGIFNPQT
jgi:acyl-CoA reductase-like NAD-dependent aldehyde dehydrogenase